MNDCVAPLANSLIFTGLVLRNFTVAVSDCGMPLTDQDALATRSPLKAAEPDVILYLTVSLAPGAMVPGISPSAVEVHCLGSARFNLSPVIGVVVVFLKVKAAVCDDPGENVKSPSGRSFADAEVTLSAATSYFAATILA